MPLRGSEPYFKGLYLYEDGLYEQAAEQFIIAADLGDIFAYYKLGTMHQNGKGYPESIDDAIVWFRLGAESGHPDCCYSYAMALFDKGEERAVPGQVMELATKAAKGGNLHGMWLLGNIYREGIGVDPDPVNAKRWYEEAVNHGLADASKDLKELRTEHPELFGEDIPVKAGHRHVGSSQDRIRRSEILLDRAHDAVRSEHRRFLNPTEALSCTRCSSTKVSRYGHDSKDRQKYRCSKCRYVFIPSEDNIFKGSKLSYDDWYQFASCYAYGMSMRETAKRCGVCQKTASLMKRKLEGVMGIASRRDA